MLTADRNKLEAIFDGLTDAVMVVDYDGPVRFSNSAAARAARRRPACRPRRCCRSCAAPPRSASPPTRRCGSATAPTRCSARALPDERAVLAVVRDRTDEMRREFAEADFVSNAAHELRNPLAGISGAIEVLQGGAKDDPAGARPLPRPPRRGRRADEPPDPVAADPGPGRVARRGRRPRSSTCRSRSATSSPRSRRRRTSSCAVEVEPDLAAKGDPTLLRQVLIGLLTNAFKNTPPPGTVTVRGRRDGETEVVIGSDRHRNRHPRGGDRARLRALLPPHRVAQAGGLRPRPGDRPPHGRRDGRRDRRHLGRGRGQHLLGPPPASPSRARPRSHEGSDDEQRTHPDRRRRALGPRLGRLRARPGGLRGRPPPPTATRRPRSSATASPSTC